MTSKIKYQKNYTEFNETYQLVLPLSLEGLVPDDDSVRLLSHELEELDYTLLYKAYSSKGRNPAVDDRKIYIQSAFRMDTEQKTSSELASLMLTKDFFKKTIVRMDIPHNFYDENGIFHCNLIDLLLGRVELF